MLRRWGGVSTRAQLVTTCGRAAVDGALRKGELEAVARGRYALPGASGAARTAHALHGVLSHESAALQHGWGVLLPPEAPHVTVPRHRNVASEQRKDAVLHWADLTTDDVSGSLTSQSRTVVDCMRTLDMRQGLAVADSALRAGRSPAWLATLARDARGRGSGQVRRIAREASELAANPFESGLRAIGLGVDGLNLRPQVPLYAEDAFIGRPDLVDLDLGIVAEADSFEWHGGRDGLVRDSRRYNAMAVQGWLVLRFTWDDVVFHPAGVEATLRAAVAERAKVTSGPSSGASRRLSPVRLRDFGA